MSEGSATSREALVHRGEHIAREMIELVGYTQHADPTIAQGAVDGLKRIRDAFERIVSPTLDSLGE